MSVEIACVAGRPELKGKAGKIATGMLADVTLWDLTSLSMLPQNDPASLLALGRSAALAELGSV